MKNKLKLNYECIPVLAVGFTRSDSPIGALIRFFRGGLKAVHDKNFCNHAFIVTDDRGQLFATEETPKGLMELSLEQYTKTNNRIVGMYRWTGWDDKITSDHALDKLAEVRRRQRENSRYDFIGLLSFVPFFRKFVKPNPRRQWCSENVASVHKINGATFIDKSEIAPDQLMCIMNSEISCKIITNFYL